MIALVQRVAFARVRIDVRVVGAIDAGLLVFVCAAAPPNPFSVGSERRMTNHRKTQVQLPAIMPGEWRDEILAGRSANLGQVVQPRSPRQSVEFGDIAAQLGGLCRRRRRPGDPFARATDNGSAPHRPISSNWVGRLATATLPANGLLRTIGAGEA